MLAVVSSDTAIADTSGKPGSQEANDRGGSACYSIANLMRKLNGRCLLLYTGTQPRRQAGLEACLNALSKVAAQPGCSILHEKCYRFRVPLVRVDKREPVATTHPRVLTHVLSYLRSYPSIRRRLVAMPPLQRSRRCPMSDGMPTGEDTSRTCAVWLKCGF